MKYRRLYECNEPLVLNLKQNNGQESVPTSNHQNRLLAPNAYTMLACTCVFIHVHTVTLLCYSTSISWCDSTYYTRSCQQYTCFFIAMVWCVRACVYMCVCACVYMVLNCVFTLIPHRLEYLIAMCKIITYHNPTIIFSWGWRKYILLHFTIT